MKYSCSVMAAKNNMIDLIPYNNNEITDNPKS
jgi:hypothetical protein